ncbi:uncharacterized protein [Paramisgurnus dabryanus]|uniref:uncharacterized protein n=1 Tax=Paramisgurnus dabryanus TaxID=90735 RepID=UPI003CCFB576
MHYCRKCTNISVYSFNLIFNFMSSGCLTLSNTEGRINLSRGVSGPKVGGCSDRFPDLTIHQSRDSSLFPDGKSKTPFIYTLDDSPKACLTLNNTKGGVVDGLKVGVCSDGFPDLNTCQSQDSSLFAERKIVRERFIDTVDDSPKVGREGKGARIRGLFKRACKAVARPFLSCRRNKVKPIVPPLKPDKSSSGLSVQYASSPEDSLDSGSYWVGDTSDACPAQVKSSAKVWSMADQTSYTDSFEETHVLNTSDIASASLDDSADHRKGVEELMNAPSGSIETLSLDAHSAVKASSRAVKRRSLSADSWSSGMTYESSEAAYLDFEYGMNMAEICPEEQCAKKKAGKWGIVKRTWKAIERTFLSCVSTKVEPFVPPLQPDTSPSYQESFDDYVETYYNVGDVLGEGCFGSVCEATRISDGQKVAIKFIHKLGDDRTLAIPGYSEPLITEVALMVKMSEPPLSPNVIQMIESFEDDEKLAIVMEYPQPCITLHDYITENEMLCEEIARILMRQAVQAVIDCIDHGVVHTDIHPGNILITSTLGLKLIDFSCGQLFTRDVYDISQYVGNRGYCPPEVTETNRFHAISANVWSLGVLLFEMVNGCLPDPESEEVLFVNPDLSGGLDLKVLDTTQD